CAATCLRRAAQAPARRRADRQPRCAVGRADHRALVRAQPRAGHHARAGDARRSARFALYSRGAPRRRPHRMKRAWRMLRRDWRAGELSILAAALVIAVAAVTSVGFFADRVSQGLERDAHQLLGADLVLISDHPWSAAIVERVRRAGAAAEALNFVSMALAGGEAQLAG